jgi:hypothetical protein
MDGYWTPYHLANARIEQVEQQRDALQAEVERLDMERDAMMFGMQVERTLREKAEAYARTCEMMRDQSDRYHKGAYAAMLNAGCDVTAPIPDGKTLGVVCIEQLHERAMQAEVRVRELEAELAQRAETVRQL